MSSFSESVFFSQYLGGGAGKTYQSYTHGIHPDPKGHSVASREASGNWRPCISVASSSLSFYGGCGVATADWSISRAACRQDILPEGQKRGKSSF